MNETGLDSLCHRRVDCRLCGSRSLQPVLNLTPTPPANAFVPKSEIDIPQPEFPLDVFLCNDCGHAQLLDVVDPEYLFRSYVYVSGTSPSFVRHFDDYAAQISTLSGAHETSLVVDIGSNDGTLLNAFKQRGYSVLGVDPARDIAHAATQRGIETLPRFFNRDVAAEILGTRGPASIVTANNVFAHSDDLSGLLDGVGDLLAGDGLFVNEVSYLLDVVEHTLFDTIYHEHLSYHAVAPLRAFYEKHGLTLIAAERVSSHGGSIRCIAAPSASPRARTVDENVDRLIEAERDAGILTPAAFTSLGRKIDTVRTELSALLRALKAEGKRIAGFGAPAKATTFMYHFGIDRELIEYIIDDSPLKQGLYSPGLHIPVVDRSVLDSPDKPDILIVLAWNFAGPITKNNWEFAEQGGKFLIPLPKLEVIPS